MRPCMNRHRNTPDMRRTRFHVQRAFSLIELMCVLAVLGILLLVALPAYVDSVRKARRAEGRAALMKLMQQQERFYTVNNRYVAFSSSSTVSEEKQFQWYSGDTASTSFYEISGAACEGDVIRDCILLTARPGTGKVNVSFNDAECPQLTLSSTGNKTARVVTCWN